MTIIDELEPKSSARVMDLVREAGVDVREWGNYAGGEEKAAANPKYCYEWAFVEEGKVVVLNLWHSELKSDGNTIYRELSLRGDAIRYDKAKNKAVWGARARKMDAAIQTAFLGQLQIRVILCKGVVQDIRNPQSVASRVRARKLDPVEWAVTAYDMKTGKCTITRGATPVAPVPASEMKKQLDAAMRNLFSITGRETGYWGGYFLREVKSHGGLATAKRMLGKKLVGMSQQKGFNSLVEAGRVDLSVESMVLEPRFRSLFTDPELAEAQKRLDAVPKYARRIATPVDNACPEELADEQEFIEGAKKQITVNAYERDPKARAACIRRHGYVCQVCGVKLREFYGLDRDVIHVHHKKPLAGRRESYQVNPTKDLAPVCPNCHAVLHTSTPPLGIEELKSKLKNNSG